MKKRIAIAFLMMLLTFAAAASGYAFYESDNIEIIISGKSVELEISPRIISDRVFLPVRSVFEYLKADVEWDDIKKTASCEKDGKTIIFTLGEREIKTDDKSVFMDTTPEIIDDRMYIPIRYAAECMGKSVYWLENMRCVIISDKKADEDGYITCWGDSLTRKGGWTDVLESLSKLPLYNAGTDGEAPNTICARQGSDPIVVNNIVIPASSDESVVLGTQSEPMQAMSKKYVSPLLQPLGGIPDHVNPVMLGSVEGTLEWTGESYADTNGVWKFTRNESGKAVEIFKPTVLRTNYDQNRNSPYLMVIFMGTNGELNVDELIEEHRAMLAHANEKEYIILGLHTGCDADRGEYEEKMRAAFKDRFLSLRRFLCEPVYDEYGNIISCRGIELCGEEMIPYFEGDSMVYDTAMQIREGRVPRQLLLDNTHYNEKTKKIIGEYIFKECAKLGIF